MTPEDFWAKIDRSGGSDACWPWTAGDNGRGYGRGHLNGRLVYAHRAAYALTKGAIPPGLFVMHRCDNPACCNPAHLSVGTHTANMRDAARKGRLGGIAQKARTHCPRGHSYSGDNLRITPEGERACRQCVRERRREQRALLVAAGLNVRGTPRIYSPDRAQAASAWQRRSVAD